MKLTVTAESVEELKAFLGWLRLSMMSMPPALRRLDITYTSFDKGGCPMGADVELEFNENLDNEK